MSKILVLTGNRNSQFFQFVPNNKELSVYSIYNGSGWVGRAVRKLFSMLDFCPSRYFGDWKDTSFDFVIISDDTRDKSVLNYIKKKMYQLYIGFETAWMRATTVRPEKNIFITHRFVIIR